MVDRNRKTVKDYSYSIQIPDTLGELATHLEELLQKYGPNAELCLDHMDNYSDHYSLYIQLYRLENDKEYKKRIINEEYWEKQREDRERQDYLKLKAKFEGGDK